jgi:hypothetical protein
MFVEPEDWVPTHHFERGLWPTEAGRHFAWWVGTSFEPTSRRTSEGGVPEASGCGPVSRSPIKLIHPSAPRLATATLQPRRHAPSPDPRLAPPHALIATATLQPPRLATPSRHAGPLALAASPDPHRHACPQLATPLASPQPPLLRPRPLPHRPRRPSPQPSSLRSLPLLDLLHRSFPLSRCGLCAVALRTCVLPQSTHVIARHVEAAVERPGDGFARGSGRVRSREPPEREEPRARRMAPGLQNS